MKKNICPICGVEVFVSNKETTICENCFTKLDNELILKSDKLKLEINKIMLHAILFFESKSKQYYLNQYS